jgi:hypothetical protein
MEMVSGLIVHVQGDNVLFKRTHITPKGTIAVAEIIFRRGGDMSPRAVLTSLQICYYVLFSCGFYCFLRNIIDSIPTANVIIGTIF